MTTSRQTVLAAAVASLVLAGCGNAAPDSADDAQPTPAETAAIATTPPTSPEAPPPTDGDAGVSPTGTPPGAGFEYDQAIGEPAVYLVELRDDPEAAQDPGRIGCGDIAVAAMPVDVAGEEEPVRVAMEELLDLDGNDIDVVGYDEPLWNALDSSDLTYERGQVWPEDDTVEVWLTGDFLGGGTCEDPRIFAQLELTAASAAGVSTAHVYVDGENVRDILDPTG